MARVKAGFKAGDIVQVKADAFEDRWDGAARDYVLEDHVYANYHCTAEDTERWYQNREEEAAAARAAGRDTFSIFRDDAGESRLPPRGGRTKLFRGQGYRVLRARCRESFSYYNPTGGWTKLLDLNTGREVFIKMTKLEKVTV